MMRDITQRLKQMEKDMDDDHDYGGWLTEGICPKPEHGQAGKRRFLQAFVVAGCPCGYRWRHGLGPTC